MNTETNGNGGLFEGSSFMNWNTLGFGKYEGKSLPQVLFTNPDWFFWAMEEEVFNRHPLLQQQAKHLVKKATHIKVPQQGPVRLVVEHFVHLQTNRYSHFNLVPVSKPLHQGSSQAHRQDVIDLSFARRICPKDSTGNRNIVRSLKQIYFGGKPTRMNRERCEAFFSSPDNFDL